MDIKERRIVKNVLINCMGLKQHEKFLVVTDEKLFELANMFHSGAGELGYESLIVKYVSRNVHGEEPPQLIKDMLLSADVVLLLTSKSLSHTLARKAASKFGVRMASLPDISREVVMRTLGFDYSKITEETNKTAKKLTRAKKIAVKTQSGTDISFSVIGRKGFSDTGIYKYKGRFGNLPAGEVCVAPLEGTAKGVIVIDASIADMGKLNKPLTVEIKNGLVVKSKPEHFKKQLDKYGKNCRNIVEFGIGLNPKAHVTGNVLEDEKALGACHFAFGTNISFGGKVKAPVHIDAVLHSPEICLDGRLLNIGG
ncbi:MAG: aminopeptidase [Candidatus Saelkia tenebricola]|nr:aminopeptidase [Candidatus Saelkia tenebricola]